MHIKFQSVAIRYVKSIVSFVVDEPRQALGSSSALIVVYGASSISRVWYKFYTPVTDHETHYPSFR
jgi:hypothetical protein